MPSAWPRVAPSILAFALVAAACLACGCGAPIVDEPLRVGNVSDPGPEALGLQRGVTAFAEAQSALAARGLTGIVQDQFAPEGGGLVGVLAADYQSRVLVFRRGVYDGSVLLPTGGLPPYGMALRIVRDRTATRLLVLLRDPLDRADFPPQLLSFDWQGDRFELAARASLGELVTRRGGMTHPMFIGDDLADGVLLVARDAGGALWDTSYFVRMPGQKLTFEAHAMSETLQCSCVQKYALGAVSH